MRWVATSLTVLWLLVPGASTGITLDFSQGPVVFDFEDGLQEWTPGGSVQRVATQVLGGDWAIFGDGLSEISLAEGNTLRLAFDVPTALSAIELDLFFLGDWDGAVPELVVSAAAQPFGSPAVLPLQSMTAPDPAILLSNPGLRVRDDLAALGPLESITIAWTISPCFIPPGGSCVETDDRLLALVDDITLKSVPEPGTAGLVTLGLGSAWLAGLRSGRRGTSLRARRRRTS